MYYVLFEIGNDAFFLHITEEYCSIVVQEVIGIYKAKALSQENSEMIDANTIEEELTKQGKSLTLLNCGLFPSIHCKIPDCEDCRRVVLASDQLAIIEDTMTKEKKAYIRARTQLSETGDRIRMQRILQKFTIVNMLDNVEWVHIRDRPDPIEYKRMNPDEYRSKYINKTNRLKDKSKNFVYVRAKTNSDYNDFMAGTELPNVTPCDALQAIP